MTRFLTTALALALSAPLLAQQFSGANQEGQFRYLVQFEGGGVLDQRGLSRSAQQLNPESATFRQIRDEIQAQQTAQIQAISSTLGRELEVSHYFLVSQNGIGTRLTPTEAETVRSLAGIASVERERVYELNTYRGPEFIGADSIWSGSSVPDGSSLRGEGMIVAMLDTGVNTDHPSYANDSACPHGGANPDKLIAALDCSSTDMTGRCNGPDPEDTDGHGSHTASTVVGNTLDETATPPPMIPDPFTEMSGVAPCAHIRAYKVCPGTSCPGFDINAGMDTVLLDGDVEAMNFSISGGTNPWADNDRRKLDLVASGVFVAASAGNTGDATPDPVGEVNHRGPWVMSVAASTRDGDFNGAMSLTGPGTPPATTQNVAMDRGSDSPLGDPLTDHSITRDPDQNAGFEGCNAPDGVPFPTDFFVGSVALIQRGGCTFTEKINNAASAGADMVVIWNNVDGALSMATPGQADIPAYSISLAEGQAVADFIDANPGTTTMDFNLIPVTADVLAGFSLRGPTPAPLQDLQKPNITAPGVDIYAARADGEEYGFLSGTSMSSPHAAGAAVLVRQAQPDWSPMEVKSALQMTAVKNGFDDDGTSPWDWDDVGSGRVDLTEAALAGLVMDETFANFLAADPSSGGDVKTLNLPSVRNVDCSPSCTWTRTLSSAQDFATSWTVSTQVVTGGLTIDVTPSTFSLLPSDSDVLLIDSAEDTPPGTAVSTLVPVEITVSGVPTGGDITFGSVDFTETGGLTPDAHITIAVSAP